MEEWSQEKLYLKERSESFCALPVLPTSDDINFPCSFLSPNIVKGKYRNTEHYLDVQYRLLREDCVRPFRDGIAEYLDIKKNNESFRYCQNVKVYCNVYIDDIADVNGDLWHCLKFTGKGFSNIKWNKSKRLLTGSLLCLSFNNFKTVFFASVMRRNIKMLKEGLLNVQFEEITEDVLNPNDWMNKNFVVLETSAYFESYRHNLMALLELNSRLLPFKRYIIDVEETVNHPLYLQETTIYDMTPLFHPLSASEKSGENISNAARNVRILDELSWPTASELNLDNSQFLALKAATTKEFAIIQGPPGTGKTYIGLRIVQLLLHNINTWFDNLVNPLPILIVCFTNHALDQFLEGLLLFTEEIVRIGGGSSNENISRYQLQKLKKKAIMENTLSTNLSKIIGSYNSQVRNIKRTINDMEKCIVKCADSILSVQELEEYMLDIHFESLQEGYPQHAWQQNKLILYIWLGLNVDKNHDSKMTEYIKHLLKFSEMMIEDVVIHVDNVWNLNYEERWELYKYWLQKYIDGKKMKSLYLQEELKNKNQAITEMRTQEDLSLLVEQKIKVVGMTTNGAAKYRHLVRKLNPAILIVEEAAEVLESHIVTSLAPNTKHVILIGDQQQLRPSTTVHMLAVKYHLDVSLFERMILNEVEFCRLSVQHRMRPEIAALIVPHIYPNLENHKTVTEFENLKGVKKNVFFVSHSFNELSERYSESKSNKHEAKFLIQFCRYLILQGYDPSRITVLTTYTAQFLVLKELASDIAGDVQKVHFTVIDKYQGEENDIILISFVRSNDAGSIGFLKVPNRVCVALSRAKKGLFCIGNFNLFAEKNTLWKNIIETLRKNQSIGSSLQLVCQNHPETCTEVSSDADFKKVPEGGCFRECDILRSCGHVCSLMCHPYDHEKIKCKQPCMKICEKGHPCEMRCYEDCYCTILCERTLEKCGHTMTEICGKPENQIKCKNPCKKSCENCHLCEKKCYADCYCEVPIDRTLSKCGHTVTELCGKPEKRIKCPLQCIKILKCTHQCTKKCGEGCILECREPCLKTCKEGHKCLKRCFEICDDCKVLVDRTCNLGHKYQKECFRYDFCEVLVHKTLEQCRHTVKMRCGENELTYRCMLECKKILHCSHQCTNKCSEYCVVYCREQCLKTCENGHKCPQKCFQPCSLCKVEIDRTLVQCGHTVKAPCGTHEEDIFCYSKCDKKLLCGHYCTKKCGEPCVKKCMQLKEAVSPICGHFINVECYIADESGDLLKQKANKLLKRCIERCREVLLCGHKCTGTCGSCYQQRMHVLCNAPCEKTLICGHKCRFSCSISCPPCQQPCENKCIHTKCPKKCGEPCNKCKKRCGWSCRHKKCTRRCNEICNRKPCNKSCKKILSCSHPCIGFCGEPCPKLCRICDKKKKKNIFCDVDDDARYVLLEDCGHTFEMLGLNQWMKVVSNGNSKIRMKTCPQCGTVIRHNFRYNDIVKNSLLQIEKVKKIIKWDKEQNKELQTILLKKYTVLTASPYFRHRNDLSKCLSSFSITTTKELTNVENIISIANGLCDLKIKPSYPECSSHEEAIKPLIQYAEITCRWLADFILKNFLVVSDHQLLQLCYEIYRLRFIERLLHYVNSNFHKSHYFDFENCEQYLISYAAFNNDSIKAVTSAFQGLTSKLIANPIDMYTPIEFPYLKAMDMSSGHWNKCSKGHIYCITEYIRTVGNGCYECMKKSDGKVCKSKKSLGPSSIIQSGTESLAMKSPLTHKKNEYNKRELSNLFDVPEHYQPRKHFKRSYSRCSNLPENFESYMSQNNSKRSHSKSSKFSADFRPSSSFHTCQDLSEDFESYRSQNNSKSSHSKSSKFSADFRPSSSFHRRQERSHDLFVRPSSNQNNFETCRKSSNLPNSKFSGNQNNFERSQSRSLNLSMNFRPSRYQNRFQRSQSRSPDFSKNCRISRYKSSLQRSRSRSPDLSADLRPSRNQNNYPRSCSKSSNLSADTEYYGSKRYFHRSPKLSANFEFSRNQNNFTRSQSRSSDLSADFRPPRY